MLVLTRKKGEGLVIGKDINITILEVKGDTIKIGIDAPKNINICRQEIYVDVQTENKKSNEAKGDLKALASLLTKK